MQTIDFSVLAKKVTARKTKLAAAGQLCPTEKLRNRGTARTPEKRELLDRAEARAVASGRLPITSHR